MNSRRPRAVSANTTVTFRQVGMESLKGTVFSSGIIEFLRGDNRWAFRAIRRGMKTTRGRVVLDPKKAPIELSVSEKLDEKSLPWLDRIRLLLGTADRVYLSPGEETLRFLQTVHELPKGKQLITLGDQNAIDAYAAEHWSRIKYFYTKRCDGFRFDIRKMFSHRDHAPVKTQRLDLETRLTSAPDESITHIMFDATGSGTANEIIDWRSEIHEGEIGRFTPDDRHIVISVSQVRCPLTFWYEYRDEFKSHAFEFEGDDLTAAMKWLVKRDEQIKQEIEEAEKQKEEEQGE